MKGTWGRRLYGKIEKGGDHTKFHLSIETREGDVIVSNFYADNKDLDRYSNMYGQVLDMMVISMDQAITHTQGTQP